MPIIKFGTTAYNGVETVVYMASGNAVKNGEAPKSEKAPAKASIAAQNNKDGTTTFVGLNGWRNKAEIIAGIQKGESILAIGPIKESEYNGRRYLDMDVDFIAICPPRLIDINRPHTNGGVPVKFDDKLLSSSGDEFLEDDGELPF